MALLTHAHLIEKGLVGQINVMHISRKVVNKNRPIFAYFLLILWQGNKKILIEN